MFFPKSFEITWEHDTVLDLAFNDRAISKIEVAKLRHVCWLDVHGKVDMSKLSPGVNYEVVFVVMFEAGSYGWGVPVDLCLVLPNGERLVRRVNLNTMPKSRWVEIHVGDFKTPHKADPVKEVSFIMFEHEMLNWKSGLVIEGAIVRPKKHNKYLARIK
ncbi:hypothetical protein MKW92_003487 [Papaver armeniacum]|nr:hypothetical protein MKW92_003487 [Papaver armeniacum]